MEDLKITLLNIFKALKENIVIMMEQKGNLSTEIETTKSYKKEPNGNLRTKK